MARVLRSISNQVASHMFPEWLIHRKYQWYLYYYRCFSRNALYESTIYVTLNITLITFWLGQPTSSAFSANFCFLHFPLEVVNCTNVLRCLIFFSASVIHWVNLCSFLMMCADHVSLALHATLWHPRIFRSLSLHFTTDGYATNRKLKIIYDRQIFTVKMCESRFSYQFPPISVISFPFPFHSHSHLKISFPYFPIQQFPKPSHSHPAIQTRRHTIREK